MPFEARTSTRHFPFAQKVYQSQANAEKRFAVLERFGDGSRVSNPIYRIWRQVLHAFSALLLNVENVCFCWLQLIYRLIKVESRYRLVGMLMELGLLGMLDTRDFEKIFIVSPSFGTSVTECCGIAETSPVASVLFGR